MEKMHTKPEVKQWHVIYTKSKWEKKVDDLLMQKGFESWCPVQKQERQWSDRKKIIEAPLFRSYVFIKASKEDYTKILSTIGVVNFLYFERKPAIIRDVEIEEIRKYLGMSTTASIQIVDMSNIPAQTKVSINQGLFMGQRGEVIKAGKKNVFVRLDSINMMMIVEFKVEEVSLR
jgi:transcription antitermination factor NusG